jgi:tRNA(Ile)-lysidine synthase
VHPFELQLAEHLKIHDWQAVTSLLAVSGGADSVALLRGLAAIRREGPGRLIVVHYQHGLRGEEAERDATFVDNLTRQMGLWPIVGRARPGELAAAGDSVERAAREARYQFFQEVAGEMGARYLFMAHTADDQAETVLHRILRGTGIAGLAGIPEFRPLNSVATIMRPMLQIRRAEVLAYLSELGQAFCEDSTNAQLHYTRNRLRHDLLPKLAAEYNPRVVEALLQLASLADEVEGIFCELASEVHVAAMRERSDNRVVLDMAVLSRHTSATIRASLMLLWRDQGWPLQQMSFAKWHELADLVASAKDGVLTLPGAIRAQKLGEKLTLTRPVDSSLD